MSIDAFRQLTGHGETIVDLLAMPSDARDRPRPHARVAPGTGAPADVPARYRGGARAAQGQGRAHRSRSAGWAAGFRGRACSSPRWRCSSSIPARAAGRKDKAAGGAAKLDRRAGAAGVRGPHPAGRCRGGAPPRPARLCDARDGLLAATALEHGLTLVTRTPAAFKAGGSRCSTPGAMRPTRSTRKADWGQAARPGRYG
jgi:hypothetical protein